jgi:hypothetical protein
LAIESLSPELNDLDAVSEVHSVFCVLSPEFHTLKCVIVAEPEAAALSYAPLFAFTDGSATVADAHVVIVVPARLEDSDVPFSDQRTWSPSAIWASSTVAEYALVKPAISSPYVDTITKMVYLK